MSTPPITFITTCKGRLRFLRQTLPLLAAQPGAECVVVDYGCPENTGDWVHANMPQAKVVRWNDRPGFNPAHARNLGAAAASGDVLCLIDSDIRVMPDFASAVLARFDPRCFYLPEPLAGDVSGTMVCARAAFEFAEGYDEACTGWGGEDFDLYDRLEFHGLKRAGFPAELLSALPHPDSERVLHHALRDKELSNSINLLYAHLKLDLMRLSGSRLPAEYRSLLHAQVSDACLESKRTGQPVRIEIPYADGTVNHNEFQTSIAFTVDLSAATGDPARAAGKQMRTSAGAER